MKLNKLGLQIGSGFGEFWPVPPPPFPGCKAQNIKFSNSNRRLTYQLKVVKRLIVFLLASKKTGKTVSQVILILSLGEYCMVHSCKTKSKIKYELVSSDISGLSEQSFHSTVVAFCAS